MHKRKILRSNKCLG